LTLDGQVRWDYFHAQLSDAPNGVFDQGLDARGLSASGSVAYQIDLGSKTFLTPSAGVTWSRVKVDPLNVSGTFILASSPGIAPPGSVQIDDIDSVLGRASVRLGTSIDKGPVVWQPFADASVYREFAGNVTTHYSSCFACLGFGLGFLDPSGGTLSTSRIGTYYNFGAGFAAALKDTGWLGYARVDYRVGENVEGISGNVGLRYSFNPPPGRGSIKDPEPVVAAGYNWSGPYIGAFAGVVTGTEDWTFVDPPNTTVSPRFQGYLLGGQLGYNYQIGRMVVGIEGELGASNAEGSKSCPSLFFFTCESELDALGSLAARVGYTWGRALFYVKGGVAIGQVAASISKNTDNQPLLIPPLSPVTETTKWHAGWTVGGGAEYALSSHWSAKGEYMHYDLGSNSYTTFFAPGATGLVDANTTADVLRVGVNYHFK
jgi:opacity protein-like surface antigen